MRAVGLLILLSAVVAGCRGGDPPPSPRWTEAEATTNSLIGGGISGMPWAVRPAPSDPVPEPAQFATLTVYNLQVPEGTASRSSEFWSRVDEQAVDVATYDVLFKNGIRVGIADVAQWPAFKALIETSPARTITTSMSTAQAKNVELPVKQQLASQTLLAIDPAGRLSGRTYEQAENLISLSFEPSPRRPGYVRVTLVPVVRSVRRRLEWKPGPDEAVDVQFVAPERYFDLNLRADVGPGKFLIIAPSPEANSPTSVGRAFLTSDAAAERNELILVIVPRAIEARPVIPSAMTGG